ncbi:MAG: hypothetical protein QXP38_00060 [Nitrososphaerota archaeon]
MPVAVTPRSRRKYIAALRDIDEAIVLLGEGMREDAEADSKAIRIAVEELADAARRVRKRIGKEVARNV